MAKELDGWRDRDKSLEKHREDDFMAAIADAVRSHNGWTCPHCGHKQRFDEAELSSQTFNSFVWDREAIEEWCASCGKKYFVKAFTTLKFSSCEDKGFEAQ